MSNKVLIIAEAGVNHNGSISLAKQLIDIAVNSGADAIKFQTFKAKNLVLKNAQKAEYQKLATGSTESQFDMLKKLELSEVSHRDLMAYCKEKNIMFLSSPFDSESVDFLNDLGLKIFKIPSGEITNLPYLRKIGSLGKRIILSTGMATIKEIGDALNALIKSGTPKQKITVLHTSSAYPTLMQDVNLNAMCTIRKKFKVDVGYSDHTLGIEIGIAAVALGASIIEKHITIDKSMNGPDHKSSLNPDELKKLVESIRNVEIALGSFEKKPSSGEILNKTMARKSIVAKRKIKQGELLSNENITTKRPGNGINPMQWDFVVNTRAVKDFMADENIEI